VKVFESSEGYLKGRLPWPRKARERKPRRKLLSVRRRRRRRSPRRRLLRRPPRRVVARRPRRSNNRYEVGLGPNARSDVSHNTGCRSESKGSPTYRIKSQRIAVERTLNEVVPTTGRLVLLWRMAPHPGRCGRIAPVACCYRP